MRREYNVLALVKGQERYVFVYDDVSHDQLIDVFRQWASRPELRFTWFDAAVLTDKARQQRDRVLAERSPPSRIAGV